MDAYAIDLFCGAGGLTNGVKKAGIKVVAGFDIDPACEYPYQYNNKVKFIQKDIADVKSTDILKLYPEKAIKILMGCAPCQPFSSYSHRYKNKENDKWGLLAYFSDLVKDIKPEIVSMENVPGLMEQKVFKEFKKVLIMNSYKIYDEIIYCPDYGVPQSRKRLVLLASRLGPISLVDKFRNKFNYPTVRKAIGDLNPINAGEQDPTDELHISSALSEINLNRIKQSQPGGSWTDWNQDLITSCHKKDTGKTYVSVYGRMEWDKPGPTITTQFNGYGNGRFGHPTQDRALSLREGALLQTFHKKYRFYSKDKPLRFGDVARMIGNAVPVNLGYAVGLSIRNHIIKMEGVMDNGVR